MLTSTHLTRVRELLSDPKRWTKRQSARDSDGLPVHARHPNAVCWCLTGAIYRTADDLESPSGALHCLKKITGVGIIPAFNDDIDRTHAEILETLDKAIALAKSEEQEQEQQR